MSTLPTDDTTSDTANALDTGDRSTRRTAVIAAAVDAALILVFVVLGMPAHALDIDVAEVLTVSAPFLLGWFGAAFLVGVYRAPLDPGRAAIAWAIGFSVALLLRRFLWDRGIAFSFIVVAAAFTAAELIGWRLIALLFRRGRVHWGR